MIADAENEMEVLDGLRVVSRVTALCSELSVEADPELPWMFDMCSPTRLVGGPNPDGGYYLAMIRGDRRYRLTGTRGTTAYLGFQVLAGAGMSPRRMAAYVSDTELELDAGSIRPGLRRRRTGARGTRWRAMGSGAARCGLDRRPRVRR